jgi:hypothetical protein
MQGLLRRQGRLSLNFQVLCLFYTPHLNDLECSQWAFMPIKNYTTFSNGSLGSRIDEERSEMR